MDTKIFKDKRVAILGLSSEGQDAVKFFVSVGSSVTCCDRRSKEELGELYINLQKYPVTFRLGASYLENLNKYDLLIRTPGMALFLPELVAAAKSGVKISSLTKIFFDLCPASIIGVTGTKGKGTTSTLIGEILKKSGFNVHVGGNVGKPLLSQVFQIQPPDIVVLELSSFQLEDLHSSPHIAVVLNITTDHLANADPLATNYHPYREIYVSAKKNLVKFQSCKDFAVLNADYVTPLEFKKETVAKIYYFSKSKKVLGAYVAKGHVVLNLDDNPQSICATSKLQLRGEHNWENVTASVVSARLAGASLEAIRKIVPNFKGLEHRLEFVTEVGGVKYYNDSFSTTPETAIAAIRAFFEPIILICGGSEKNSDYRELGKVIITSNIKGLILIGQTAPRIELAIMEAAKKLKQSVSFQIIRDLVDMKDMVSVSKNLAQAGDVVLLSPACASFGLFKNYKQRGQLFKKYAKNLSTI